MSPLNTSQGVFFFFQKRTHLINRIELSDFLIKKITKSKKSCHSISIICCSDDYILKINKNHLKHNYFTDIITFDYSDGSRLLEAELYISVDRVKENAGKFKSGFSRELHRVIFHGILHLLGKNDKSEKEKEEMRKCEDLWLIEYFNSVVSRGTIRS